MTLTRPDSFICPSCGAPMEAGRLRCLYCGTLVRTRLSWEERQVRLDELSHMAAHRALNAEELVELGALYLSQKQNAHASEALRKAIALQPEDWRPRLLLCLALMGFNQSVVTSRLHRQEIEQQFYWLKQRFPHLPEVQWLEYYFELERLLEAQDWHAGVRRGRQAVEQFPQNYLLRFLYGLALAHFGQVEGVSRQEYEQALHQFKLAAELKPDFEPALRNIRALEDYLLR